MVANWDSATLGNQKALGWEAKMEQYLAEGLVSTKVRNWEPAMV